MRIALGIPVRRTVLPLSEQCARLVGVVTMALKIGDDSALTCNMLQPLSDVPLRLR